jgi:hypothetical protein
MTARMVLRSKGVFKKLSAAFRRDRGLRHNANKKAGIKGVSTAARAKKLAEENIVPAPSAPLTELLQMEQTASVTKRRKTAAAALAAKAESHNITAAAHVAAAAVVPNPAPILLANIAAPNAADQPLVAAIAAPKKRATGVAQAPAQRQAHASQGQKRKGSAASLAAADGDAPIDDVSQMVVAVSASSLAQSLPDPSGAATGARKGKRKSKS